MTAAVTLSENACWLEHEHDILPFMTALFVDGLEPRTKIPIDRKEWKSQRSEEIDPGKIFRLPLTVKPYSRHVNKLKKNNQTHDSIKKIFKKQTVSSLSQHTIVRQLIGGISHHFNNLLMGIWGNATLIRMQLDPDDPRYIHVDQMERLIQSGAFLIHMVLGCLGERRTVAKQMRLNQLISEIRNETGLDAGSNDPWNLEVRLKWASQVQQPRLIASSTARVLDILFLKIEKQCTQIRRGNYKNIDIRKKLITIDSLVKRALNITYKLHLYALDVSSLCKKKYGLASIVNQSVLEIKNYHPCANFKCDFNKNLSKVEIDKRLLKIALKEVLINAAESTSFCREIDISIKTLYNESPPQRCIVRAMSNYIAISINSKDSKISEKIKKRIFQPFVSISDKKKKIGLGLAAADGILKLHSGYIQMISNKKTGITFNLCIPYDNSKSKTKAA